MLTIERIAEIRARLEAATQGAWESEHHDHGVRIGTPNHWTCVQHNFDYPPYEGELEEEYGIYPPLGEAGPVALVSGEANAQFLAQSWRNVRDLLAEAERLRTELEQVQAAISELWGFWDGNTLIVSPSADREAVDEAWDRLLQVLK